MYMWNSYKMSSFKISWHGYEFSFSRWNSFSLQKIFIFHWSCHLACLCVLYRFTRSCIQSNTMKHSFRAMSTSKCCRKWDYPSQISQKMATPVVWMRVGYQLVGTRLFNLNIKFLICINKQLPWFCNIKWERKIHVFIYLLDEFAIFR